MHNTYYVCDRVFVVAVDNGHPCEPLKYTLYNEFPHSTYPWNPCNALHNPCVLCSIPCMTYYPCSARSYMRSTWCMSCACISIHRESYDQRGSNFQLAIRSQLNTIIHVCRPRSGSVVRYERTRILESSGLVPSELVY